MVGRRKPTGQNEQVPSKMGVMRWVPNRDQVADRLQEGRFGKTEKSQLFQSLEASFPLLSLLNRFFSPHKNTFLRINGNSLEKLHVISLVNLKFKKENKKKEEHLGYCCLTSFEARLPFLNGSMKVFFRLWGSPAPRSQFDQWREQMVQVRLWNLEVVHCHNTNNLCVSDWKSGQL